MGARRHRTIAFCFVAVVAGRASEADAASWQESCADSLVKARDAVASDNPAFARARVVVRRSGARLRLRRKGYVVYEAAVEVRRAARDGVCWSDGGCTAALRSRARAGAWYDPGCGEGGGCPDFRSYRGVGTRLASLLSVDAPYPGFKTTFRSALDACLSF